MAIRNKTQISLFDITDQYSVDLTIGAISVDSASGGLTADVTTSAYVIIKRGNVTLEDQTSGSSHKTLTGVAFGQITDKQPSTANVTATLGSWNTNIKGYSFTVTLPNGLNTNGYIIIPITFTDTETGETLTFNKQITFSLSKQGGTGPSGISSATVFLYRKGDSAPAKPQNNIVYTFSTHTITGDSNWKTDPANAGTGTYLWTIFANASSDEATDVIQPSEWSPVTQVSAVDGPSGWNRAIVYLYQRASSTPTAPSGTFTYTFSSGALSGTLGSWTTSMPAVDANGNPCYVCSASFASQNATATATFGNVIKLVEDGEDGDPGYSISILSSGGWFFRNTAIVTTLTAYVSKGGVTYEDISGGDTVDEQLANEGLIVKWYNASGSPYPSSQSQWTGVEHNLTAQNVQDSLTLVAQLEDISS